MCSQFPKQRCRFDCVSPKQMKRGALSLSCSSSRCGACGIPWCELRCGPSCVPRAAGVRVRLPCVPCVQGCVRGAPCRIDHTPCRKARAPCAPETLFFFGGASGRRRLFGPPALGLPAPVCAAAPAGNTHVCCTTLQHQRQHQHLQTQDRAGRWWAGQGRNAEIKLWINGVYVFTTLRVPAGKRGQPQRIWMLKVDDVIMNGSMKYIKMLCVFM